MDSFICPQCHNPISETNFHKLDCSYADLSKRQIDDIVKSKKLVLDPIYDYRYYIK